ncbi:hypothetical protein AB0C98_26625 [Streptomyces sp. NPDC048558]|uniref:hypothetical protein n=1 Tax=Streptomyces sp. NPDC048558 TaxID=3155759 RepID=UPI0034486A2C
MSDAARRTLRTIVWTVIGLAAATPLIIDTAGIPRTAAGVSIVLAVAAGLTRVTALDAVQKLLPSWLRTTTTNTPNPNDSTGTATEQPAVPTNGGAV